MWLPKKVRAGLGCVACIIVGIAMLPSTAVVLAEPNCTGSTCTVYLPLAQVAPPLPKLIEPADGAQVASLAPLLHWLPPEPGDYQVQVAFDPAFTTMAFTSTVSLSAPVQTQEYIMEGNLIQTTLYWRVGEVKPEGYLFSPTWSFTTPVKDSSKLLAAPHLLAPANQATLPASNVTLSWQSVSGATYYRVALYAPDGTQVTAAVLAAPTTTFTLHNLSAGTTYSWRVKAFNAYGWSIYSTSWHFKAV